MPDGEAETEFLYQKEKIQTTNRYITDLVAGMTHVHRGNTVFTNDKYIATEQVH